MFKSALKISNLFVLLLLFRYPVTAQSNFELKGDTDMEVKGTSTLHDWTMKSSKGEGTALMVLENGSLKKINHILFRLPAESLKSSKSGMDKNAYNALDSKTYPNILFEARDLDVNGYQIKAKGKLTIAGKSVETEFPVKVKKENNTFVFEGSYSCKLSDFSIDPPTAMLGTIKTGDNIDLSFKAGFESK
jgi:hypothetical protein